jgi:integrase
MFYGDTESEVRKALLKAAGKHADGGLVNTNDVVTVASYLDEWFESHKTEIRPKTQRQYRGSIDLHIKPFLGPIRLARLTPKDVRTMCSNLETKSRTIGDKVLGPVSRATATLAKVTLGIALSRAVEDQVIARNVAELVSRRPEAATKVVRTDVDQDDEADGDRVLSTEEARFLLKHLRTTKHRLEGVITCGLAVGLRLGEVLGLQWDDVLLDARRIRVRHQLQTIDREFLDGPAKPETTVKSERVLVTVKSEESRRILGIPPVLVRAFERQRTFQAERRLLAGAGWLKTGTSFVFTTGVGRPLEGTLITRDLKRLLASLWMNGTVAKCKHARTRVQTFAADQGGNRVVCKDCKATQLPTLGFHRLRHSCGSLLLASGVQEGDVSALLGHSDIRLTRKIYAHVLDETRTKLAAQSETLFGT